MPCRLFGKVVKLVRQEQSAGEAPPFTVVSTLRKMLKHLGWTETAAFCWNHDTKGRIDIGPDGKGVTAGTGSPPDQRKPSEKKRGTYPHQHVQAPRNDGEPRGDTTSTMRDSVKLVKAAAARSGTHSATHDRWSPGRQPAWLRPRQNEAAELLNTKTLPYYLSWAVEDQATGTTCSGTCHRGQESRHGGRAFQDAHVDQLQER